MRAAPRSLFEPLPPSGEEIAGGVVAAVGAALLVPLLVFGTTALLATALDAAGVERNVEVEEEQPDPPPAETISARFVMLGSEIDPRQLPDRYRPSRATAPPPGEAPPPDVPPPTVPSVSTTPTPPPVTTTSTMGVPSDPTPAPPDVAPTASPAPSPSPTPRPSPAPSAAPAPTESAEDLLARLGDRADAVSTTTRPREREGDPNGIAEGTETRANADLYPGQLYVYFRRGWQAPAGIPDAELNGLSATVDVTLTQDARVGAWRLSRPSGHEGFDDSVRLRMRQAEGASLPTPPADEAARYLGRTVSLRFLGRHGR